MHFGYIIDLYADSLLFDLGIAGGLLPHLNCECYNLRVTSRVVV